MRAETGLRRVLLGAAACLFLGAVGGCASISKVPLPKFIKGEEPIVAPTELAAVWTNAVLEREGSRSTRGFGGVLTFYGNDQKRSVRVDGALTVYAYEDSGDRENPIPDRKYVFTAEQLAKHYDAKQAHGPSYHIWIPWDEVGGPQRDIDLIVRFDPVEGQSVLGKSTRAVLPGPIAAQQRVWTKQVVEPFAVRQASATMPRDANDGTQTSATPARMQTTTLTLPRRGE
ncbi:MAG: hypothetical protein GX621_17085 [Pirellulaceae bacterium]|nr:hypothetical protein [Pirellulaceae bacterium]